MSRPINEPPSQRPYIASCEEYLAAGWFGPLPLPAKRKGPPPIGYTGRSGVWPSRADVAAWALGDEGVGNIGLRLPEIVIGIDVDAYGDKIGGVTLARLVEELGPLPPTTRSSSRDDGISGIYLFRVPPGLAWPGELGAGIEIIQHSHRYAVVWPSVHPEGRIYRWINGEGLVLVGAVPRVDELPELPARWVEHITGGQLATELIKADLTDDELLRWVSRHGSGAQCYAVRETVDRYIADRFGGGSSRHDAARDATARLFGMASEGHKGVLEAVNEIGHAFRAAVEAGANARRMDESEWRRLWVGAVRLAAVDTSSDVVPSDPCAVTVLDDEALLDRVRTASASSTLSSREPQISTSTSAGAGVSADSGTEVPPVTVLDVSTISVADAERLAAQRAIEAELRVQRTRREARRLLDLEAARELFREPPSLFTLADELTIEDDDVTWSVDELLPSGGNALLTAQYKTGKTTLLTNLARCYADGEPFLGRYDVAALDDGRVALWNYEVGASQYRRWLRDSHIGAADRVAVLNLRGYTLPLNVPMVADWCVRWLVERRVRVWVVDPFARAFTGTDENSNTEVARWLDALDEIKSRAGVDALVLSTHTGRAEQDVGAERARGATRLDDWPDVRWLLTRDTETGVRYFRATGRDVEIAEDGLDFDVATRSLTLSGNGGRHVAKQRGLAELLLGIIETTPGLSQSQIVTAAKRNRDDVRECIASMIPQRIITKPGPRGAARHFILGPSIDKPGKVYALDDWHES